LCYTAYYIGYNSDAEKTRLQNRMAFGQDSVPIVAPTGLTPVVAKDEESIDRFEEGGRNSSQELVNISIYSLIA